jgi:ubiquinone/menaquinone biosynthesis C-methylase UbiE
MVENHQENDEFYWGEILQTDMQAVNALARKEGWQQALETLVRPRYPAIYRYVTNPVRTDWRFLLPLPWESTVLDLGAGWGTISFQLANAYQQVVALELVTERLEFISIRCQQTRRNRVCPVQGDMLKIPLAPNSFDLVVMNGVLEWAGVSDLEGGPRDVQLRFLRRARELLKPGGYLYIGIENRIAYTAFLGAEDHSGLSYTSLMPRALANFYVRAVTYLKGLRKGEYYRTAETACSYRTYTYTYFGYSQLLKEAGFQGISIYAAIPGYNDPRHLVKIDDACSFRYLLQMLHPCRQFNRLLLSLAEKTYFLSFHKYFASEFCIFAQR